MSAMVATTSISSRDEESKVKEPCEEASRSDFHRRKS
jgi:hypothetical protein